jgi:hypothetical protein
MSYYMLSDYVHLSFRHTYERLDPKRRSYFNANTFDEIFSLFLIVSDIVIFLTIEAIIIEIGADDKWRKNYNDTLRKALGTVFESNGGKGLRLTRRFLYSDKFDFPKVKYPS